MSLTTAVPRDTLNWASMSDEGRPLCPARKGGRLPPLPGGDRTRPTEYPGAGRGVPERVGRGLCRGRRP